MPGKLSFLPVLFVAAALAACDSTQVPFEPEHSCRSGIANSTMSGDPLCRMHYIRTAWAHGDWLLVERQLIIDHPDTLIYGQTYTLDFEWSGWWFMRPDGTAHRPFIIGHGSHLFTPAWSPDGRHILFTVGHQGPVVMYTMTEGGVDAIGPRGITPQDLWLVHDGNFQARSPMWSPDGRYAGFNLSGNPDRSERGIWRFDMETRQAIGFQMPPPEDACLGCQPRPGIEISWIVGHSTWNPARGDELVFTTTPNDDLARRDPGHRIAIYDTTTASVTFIRQQPIQERVTALAVSPDGEWIAFAALAYPRHFMQSHLWIMRRDGTGLRVLDPHGGYPTWSPDGRIIYTVRHDYDPPEGENGHLHSIRPDGSDRRQITFDQEWVRPEID